MITIVPLTNGTYYGALDAPQQRISRMPVEITLNGTDLTLRMEQAGSSFVGKVLDQGAKFSGTWTQPGVKAPMVLRRQVGAPQAPVAKVRMSAPYRETTVTFQNPTSRQRLGGTLTVPAGEGPFPAVVLLSDLGPQTREVDVMGYHMFGQLADYFTRHGIAVLRFDDRGVGKSGGNFADATMDDFVTDARAALNYLRTRPLIASQHVGLLGHGEGANVALLAATASEHAPAFVVSLAGYGQPGHKVMEYQQGEIMRLIGSDLTQVKAAQDVYQRIVNIIRATPDDHVARSKVAAILGSVNTGLDAKMTRARAAQLTSPSSRFFFDFDPLAQISEVQCPVLLLNGTADLQVSAKRHMTPLHRALNRAHRGTVAYRINGVNHLFQPPASQWPMVNGTQQPTFSPDALKKMHAWVAIKTKDPIVVPSSHPAKQPAPLHKAAPLRKSDKAPTLTRN